MNASRRSFLAAVAGGLAAAGASANPPEDNGVKRYVRFKKDGSVGHGELVEETIHVIGGDLFGSRERTGETTALDEVKLLYPVEPVTVLALARNYVSHVDEDQEVPERPEGFFKPRTSLQHPGDPIIIPAGARNVHYEAEFVIVIGKKAKDVSEEDAADAILGYTCGNDVSERDWQDNDVQWWRAKGSDTFGPMGPVVAVGLDYEKSKIQLRLNGEVRQEQMLSDLVHKPAQAVSFISRYVTLHPGDVIFTGTPGKTGRMKPGDVAEVEVDGIGILRNPVKAAS